MDNEMQSKLQDWAFDGLSLKKTCLISAKLDPSKRETQKIQQSALEEFPRVTEESIFVPHEFCQADTPRIKRSAFEVLPAQAREMIAARFDLSKPDTREMQQSAFQNLPINLRNLISAPFDFSKPDACKRHYNAFLDAVRIFRNESAYIPWYLLAYGRFVHLIFTAENIRAFGQERLAVVSRVRNVEFKIPIDRELSGQKMIMRNDFESITHDLTAMVAVDIRKILGNGRTVTKHDTFYFYPSLFLFEVVKASTQLRQFVVRTTQDQVEQLSMRSEKGDPYGPSCWSRVQQELEDKFGFAPVKEFDTDGDILWTWEQERKRIKAR